MTKLLLTLESFENVKAGVEIFSLHLKNVFKDLKIINADTVGFEGKSKLAAPFRDVIKAKAICDYVNKNIESLKPEIIFVNGLCGWALSKEINVPVVCILHGGYAAYADAAMKFGLDYLRTKYIYAHFEALSARRATHRIANSEFTRKNIKRYCNLESTVIHNGIDTTVFKPLSKKSARKKLKLDLEGKIGLFVGRPDYAKGFDILEKVAKTRPEIEFIAVLYPKVESTIQNLRIAGPLEPKELRKYYCAADFVINPTRFEGFGYVNLEGLACNTSVIASNTGMAKELKMKPIVKVSNNNAKEYGKKLENCFWDGASTHKFVKMHFSLDVLKHNYIKFANIIMKKQHKNN